MAVSLPSYVTVLMMFPPKYTRALILRTVEFDLIQKRVFADIISLSSYLIGVSPNPMTGVLKRRENRDTDMHRRECHVKMKTEIRVMFLQTKGHKGLPTTTKRQEKSILSESLVGTNPAHILISTSRFSSYEKINFCCFKSPSQWLQQAQK